MALPLIPLAIAAVIGILTLTAKKKDTGKPATGAPGPVAAATSPLWKPINAETGMIDIYGVGGPALMTPLSERIGLTVGQHVTVVLELPLAPDPVQNPHVLCEMEIVTVGAPTVDGGNTYGLKFIRMLAAIDKNFDPAGPGGMIVATPRPDPSVAFIASTMEIAQVR